MKAVMIMTFLTIALAGVAQSAEWELAWSDEFDYEGLPDKSKWDYEEGFVRNREMQYYTKARKENVRVEDGILVIEGRKEEFNNPKHKSGSTKWQEQRKVAGYTSGSINTLGKGAFLYGRVEVRAKVPQGNGMWPAIWMMGTNRSEVGWPRCGEIDIMEYVGKHPHQIHATTHFAGPKKAKDKSLKGRAVHRSAGKGKITIKEPWKDFHVYAMEWDKKEIRFFADNKLYGKLVIDTAGKGTDNPFRKPHYLLLNLAIGGSWGSKIDDTVLPQKYEIDYVRYYKSRKGQQEDAGDGKQSRLMRGVIHKYERPFNSHE